ncbi:MAG: ATP-binding protein [Rhodospirillales bacterium]|nr:ATP-binding protein [Rhodospirillales bacterium]
MAKTARQIVFDGMELIPEALIPFVEKRLDSTLKGHWQLEAANRIKSLRPDPDGQVKWDQPALLKAMIVFWKDSFSAVLGTMERSIVHELLEVRNDLSHNKPFSYDAAARALDSMGRLCEAISAGETAGQITKMYDTIMRTKYYEQARAEERKIQTAAISAETLPDLLSGLLPWRQVVEPHDDVATGEFQQAEFAADLAKVHNGSAPGEYSDPREFFSRTYLTDGLSRLLEGAAKRLSGQAGDPVVELQTNFGGGKTHSMLALYHLAGDSGAKDRPKAQDLPGLDQLLSAKGLRVPNRISRAVLVGTARGPADPVPEAGGKIGREIRTTWGELAWQLGGPEAFGMLADNDARGIAPGSDLLQAIFGKCAPNLILIDEWVAYLRQIYKIEGLPSGSFDANISFVQSLTEAVKASPQTLLVASLPASQIEIGGEGGQEALERLKQTFSRVESSWRPASQEESYEIVRRRLFKEIEGGKYSQRDNTLKQFAKLYRDNPKDFPQGCAEADYRRKLEKAYPIHPELFGHLYTAWGSLESFQRTRGVLRLMAQVIHQLWMERDPSAMIMPGSLAIRSERVEPELLRYLPSAWQGIIANDVDGAEAVPYSIDRSKPSLNRCAAARRVARAIFVATAPGEGQQNPGIDDRQINLGVVQPGEKASIFGDALRHLTDEARFMHSNRGRYWYSMTPNLNRMASDRAGQLEEALILEELDKALTGYIDGLTDRGLFDAVQTAPADCSEVPDETGGIRAVVLGIAHPHARSGDSRALAEAWNILQQRGATPRVYRNRLVFLAGEQRGVDGLNRAMRDRLAWEGIVEEARSKRLDLKTSEIVQAEAMAERARETLQLQMTETWRYLIYPYQDSPESDVELIAVELKPVRLNKPQDGLLDRASKQLFSDNMLLPEIGPESLNKALTKYIWDKKPHLPLTDLWEYLSRYVYLPRLQNRQALIRCVQAAISEMLPGPFAYAEGWEKESGSYSGLAIEQSPAAAVSLDGGLLVQADVAQAKRPQPAAGRDGAAAGGTAPDSGPGGGSEGTPSKPEAKPKRFAGTVRLSAERPARDMNRILEAIVEQLSPLPGAKVSLTLEIEAEVASGLDHAKVRTLLENAVTLNFIDKSVH